VRFAWIDQNLDKYSISEMCRILEVTAQGYRKWKIEKPYKHALLLARIKELIAEHPLNKNYGVKRIFEGLKCKYDNIPSLSTVRRVMRENGIKRPKNSPKGLTKADKLAQKSDNLINGDFTAEAPNQKLLGDITQVETADGNLYIAGTLDCFDNQLVGLAMDDNMKSSLVIGSLEQAHRRFNIRGAIFHSDRGSQYTGADFRAKLAELGVLQSMNGAAGRCHDNAKMESVWGRFKEELIYQLPTKQMSMFEVKQWVFRYFMGYWNNARICSAIGGMPPARKRMEYYGKIDRYAA